MSLDVRRTTVDDEQAVLKLLEASLGWVPDDSYRTFFAWKHRDNPFGASPAWVAIDGTRIVGFRTFVRWEFTRGGDVVRAVRAVDTATHPEYQGRGIFKLLTLRALDELADEGVAFVFNTPNDQSRPGYLKMGWQLVDRLPVLARPRTPLSLLRLATARVPADKWSQPTAAGEPAGDALADRDAIAKLLASQPGWDGLRTNRTPAHLAWRYGFGALSYRAVVSAHGIDDGFVVFRLRRRGGAVEAALVDALVPGGDAAHARALWARALRQSRADYGARLAGDGYGRGRYLPVPNQGPTFVWRAVSETAMAPAAEWRLGLGDIELF